MWRRDAGWECVALRGVTVRVRVGLHAFERERPQRVAVDVELYRRHDGGRRADLATCLDYDRLRRYLVEEWPARPHTDLLEDLAEDLVAFCLGDPRVEACRVTVRKPDIYAGQGVPEVQLYRLREGSA
jgi:dihydroneopterin aldolase